MYLRSELERAPRGLAQHAHSVLYTHGRELSRKCPRQCPQPRTLLRCNVNDQPLFLVFA